MLHAPKISTGGSEAESCAFAPARRFAPAQFGNAGAGFDAPESGSLAKCDREREIADRAAAHMRSLVASGSLELRLVRCSYRPGTEGHPCALTVGPVAGYDGTAATWPK